MYKAAPWTAKGKQGKEKKKSKERGGLSASPWRKSQNKTALCSGVRGREQGNKGTRHAANASLC